MKEQNTQPQPIILSQLFGPGDVVYWSRLDSAGWECKSYGRVIEAENKGKVQVEYGSANKYVTKRIPTEELVLVEAA